MIDVFSPDCLPLAVIAERLSRPGVHITTKALRWWIRRGHNGVCLEAVQLKKEWFTTPEAVNQFLAASSRPRPVAPAIGPNGNPIPSKRVQEAMKRAERMGL